MTLAAAHEDWTKLASLRNKSEADLLAGRLRQAGIRPRIVKATDDPAGWMTAFGGSQGMFEVFVPQARKKRAQQLLSETNSVASNRIDLPNRRLIHSIGKGLLALVIISVIGTFLTELL